VSYSNNSEEDRWKSPQVELPISVPVVHFPPLPVPLEPKEEITRKPEGGEDTRHGFETNQKEATRKEKAKFR